MFIYYNNYNYNMKNKTEIARERTRKWYRENKDRKMEYQKKWRASHPDYVKNYNEANLVTRTVEYYLRALQNPNINILIDKLKNYNEKLLKMRFTELISNNKNLRDYAEMRYNLISFKRERHSISYKRAYVALQIVSLIIQNDKRFKNKIHKANNQLHNQTINEVKLIAMTRVVKDIIEPNNLLKKQPISYDVIVEEVRRKEIDNTIKFINNLLG